MTKYKTVTQFIFIDKNNTRAIHNKITIIVTNTVFVHCGTQVDYLFIICILK